MGASCSHRLTILAAAAVTIVFGIHVAQRHSQAPIDEQYARALVGKWRGGGRGILTLNDDHTAADTFPLTDDWSETQVRHATWQVCDGVLIIKWVDDPHSRDIQVWEIDSVGEEKANFRFRHTFQTLRRIARAQGPKRAFNYWKFDNGSVFVMTRIKD